MSREQLEEIKKTQYQIIELSKTNMQEDFKYLLSYIDNLEMAFDDLDSDYIDLVKQNKRYREALEFYADRENYDEEMIGSTLISGSKVMYDDGKTAREALDERSNR